MSGAELFSRRLHIDEEGYPVVDGIRVNDEESLREIFGNLRRSKLGDNRSCLVTTWGKVDATVEAFSSPLIIQSIDLKSDGFCMANIFSGVCYEFKLADIQVDEWQRLHVYLGADCVEATFSRKAQSELLLSLTSDHTFARFRHNEAAVQDESFWDEAYDKRADGWDLGKVSPSFENMASRWLLGDKIVKRVLVPGAGRGYEAQWLSQKGHHVIAEDFSSSARDEFFKTHPKSKVTFQQNDFFGDAAAADGGYDAVAELIFFCAIDPQRRAEYFAQVHRRLKAGGLLVGIFYVSYGPGGPPYPTTPWELKSHAKGLFHVKHWQVSPNSVPSRLGKEFEMVLQKRL